MSTAAPADSLESNIERAWLQLTEATGLRNVYVFRGGGVSVSKSEEADNHARQLVGAFTRAIGLQDFRAEVYHVWEGMRR